MALYKTSLHDNLAEGYRYLALNNLASYHLLKGNFREADILYEKSLKENLHNEDIAQILFNIGLTRKKQGDYSEALRMLDRAETLSFYQTGLFRAEIFNLKSRIYIRLQNWEEARKNNIQALSHLQSFNDEVSLKKKLELAFGRGLIETASGNPQKAFEVINTGKKIQSRLDGYRTEITHGILARIYSASGKTDSAVFYAQLALGQLIQSLPDLPRHPLIAEAWLDLGDIFLKAKKFDDAEFSYTKGLACLVNQDFSSRNLPDPESVIYPVDAVPLICGIGSAYLQKFQQSGVANELQQATDAYLLATRLIPRIYREFQNEDSRLFMAGQAVHTYEQAIALTLELARHTSDKRHLETAFYLAEQNKAALLYFALSEAEKIKSLGLPDSLTERENLIKTELAFYQEKIFEESRKTIGQNSEKLIRWKEKIFHLEEETRIFKKVLETHYPQYYQLKYPQEEITVSEVRKLLPKGAAWLEYFCGESATYAFKITDNEIQVEKILGRDSLDHWINAMREGIYQNWTHKNDSTGEFSALDFQYIIHARKLYQNLIAPFEKNGAKLPRELIIVPDDILGYLPFDALLTAPTTRSQRFRQFPYMIRRFEISYAYSAALLQNLSPAQSDNPSKVKIFALGPWTEPRAGNSNGPPALLFSRDEISAITSLFQSTTLLGEDATRARFLARAKDFEMIHLSTHAQINDTDSRYSRITFAADSDTLPDFLTVAEICNLRLRADMVVLSACETGVGSLQKGEGILSLARAFTYAGAKSIITTLWQVDDQATALIMKRFYRYLHSGYDKDVALRQAKLDYLENSDNRLAHPFFWAATLPSGNMKPLRTGSDYLLPALLTLLFVIALSAFYLVKKIRSGAGFILSPAAEDRTSDRQADHAKTAGNP
ncbi:MAG: CHAT domain-containing protein [Bacteroidia bacterium]|nr:CHAT domain-containing protein [Bacteroidia bacterium]